METVQDAYRNKLMILLDDLPEFQLRELYHFAVFLKERFRDEVSEDDVPSFPAEHLNSLIGLIAVGGDAVEDTDSN